MSCTYHLIYIKKETQTLQRDKKISYILKAKSNFTLLLYITFLGIGEWYLKCVEFILKFYQLFI